MSEKTCTKCGEAKSMAEFHRKASNIGGYSGQCGACDSVKTKKWYAENKERRAIKAKAWAEANRDKVVTKQIKYQKHKTAVNPVFAASFYVRKAIARSVRRMDFTKRAKTTDLLGCDWVTFEKHLSSKFSDGMSWENRSEWHIDHIIPLATAQTVEDVERLCHYTNLQPLWAADNIRKGAKIMT